MVDVPLVDISSSAIRKKVAQGCTIQYLVPKDVQNYIEREGLYQDDESKTNRIHE